MKKKYVRNKKQLKKKYQITHTFSKSGMLFSLIIISSLCLVVSTFSWFTSSDSLGNTFKGTQLAAEINEIFTPNNKWIPAEKTPKEVSIENTGNSDSYIRVSIYEFLLLFKVDTTDKKGNGNLLTVTQPVSPQVDAENPRTWEEAVASGGTYAWRDTNYVANQAIIPDFEKKQGYYKYPAVDRNSLLQEIQINFGKVVTTIPTSETKDYWLYENGYFYYSRPLKSKELSVNLINSVELKETAPNKYKNSLYQLKVFMEAHDVTEPVFAHWSINKTDQSYKLLNNYLK